MFEAEESKEYMYVQLNFTTRVIMMMWEYWRYWLYQD